MSPRRRKAFAYIIRPAADQGGRPRLLVFASPEEPGYEVIRGGLNADETPLAGALREIREESGLTDLEFVAELGAADWRDEQQHFLLFKALGDAPATWRHTIASDDADNGMTYEYCWLGCSADLESRLVQGAGRMLGLLLERLAEAG